MKMSPENAEATYEENPVHSSSRGVLQLSQQNAIYSKRSGERKGRLFLATFFVTNLLLSTYFIDLWNTPNTVSHALPVLSFSHDKTLQIDRYAGWGADMSKVGDHFYSDKAPLPTLAVIPFYEAIKAVGLGTVGEKAARRFPIYILQSRGFADWREFSHDESVPVLILGSFLCGSLPFTLIVVLSFLRIRDRRPPLSPVVMVFMAFYGSLLFVFSGTYFNHLFAGLLLLLSYIALKEERLALSGLFAGLSFLSEYTVGLVFPLWAVLILINEKRIIKSISFMAGALPSLVFIAMYNYMITGKPFVMLNAFHTAFGRELSHNYGFRSPTLTSLWGLSFSGAMGLFVFAPVLIIAAFYLLKLCLKKSYIARLPVDYLAVFSLIFFLVIASFFTWWGGWSYGPRYLIVLAVLLIYEGIELISRFCFRRSLYLALTAYGIASAWIAKSTLVFMIPDSLLYSGQYSNTLFDVLLPEFLSRRFNSNSLPTLIFGVPPFLSVILWLAIFIISLVSLSYWHTNLLNGKVVLAAASADGAKAIGQAENCNNPACAPKFPK